jgi:hypothetical protein
MSKLFVSCNKFIFVSFFLSKNLVICTWHVFFNTCLLKILFQLCVSQFKCNLSLNFAIYFQISKTVTAFLGGSFDPNAIVTYNWTTSTYTKHEARLNGTRVNHACAVMKDENGEIVVITTCNCTLFY